VSCEADSSRLGGARGGGTGWLGFKEGGPRGQDGVNLGTPRGFSWHSVADEVMEDALGHDMAKVADGGCPARRYDMAKRLNWLG